MVTRGAVIRAAAVLAGATVAGAIAGAAILFAAVELDDGRHEIFGPDLPAADPRLLPPRLALVR